MGFMALPLSPLQIDPNLQLSPSPCFLQDTCSHQASVCAPVFQSLAEREGVPHSGEVTYNLIMWPPCSKICFPHHSIPSFSPSHCLTQRKPHFFQHPRAPNSPPSGLARCVACRPWKSPSVRWSDCPPRQRPAFFQALAPWSLDIAQPYLVPSGAHTREETQRH